jgi:hypothetical protein
MVPAARLFLGKPVNDSIIKPILNAVPLRKGLINQLFKNYATEHSAPYNAVRHG